MITMGWKGRLLDSHQCGSLTSPPPAGTGNASRVLDSTRTTADGEQEDVKYTLAVLVQSNFGGGRFLTVKGVPVGRILLDQAAAAAASGEAKPDDATLAGLPAKDEQEGSIIGIIATNAPLIPTQLERLAKRAAIGMARSMPSSSNEMPS